MTEVTEFLLARIAEDEEAARGAMTLPEGVQRVASRAGDSRIWSAADRHRLPFSTELRPLGEWTWSGGPMDYDEPGLQRLIAGGIFGDERPSGVEMHPYQIKESGGWDWNDEDETASYRIAEIPASCGAIVTHIVRYDPARVLAECEAKRRIIKNWPYEPVLGCLAMAYAYHPDFRNEWRLASVVVSGSKVRSDMIEENMNATEVSHVPPDLDFITVWECEPPPDGASFRVVDQEWTADYHERHIRSWSA